jgi:hypothetical protein
MIRSKAGASMRKHHCKAQQIEQRDKSEKINSGTVFFKNPVQYSVPVELVASASSLRLVPIFAC